MERFGIIDVVRSLRAEFASFGTEQRVDVADRIDGA